MTRVYLFRHGESAMNMQPELIGGFSPETPLTARGDAQARALGAHLATNRIVPDRIYASPAVRTRETARLALAGLGSVIDPVIDPRLAELGQGIWEGGLRAHAYDDAAKLRIKAEGKTFKFEGGESMDDVAARMVAWLGDAMREPAETIFMFGHGMAIRCLLGELFAWSHGKTYETVTANTSISTISGTPWTLEGVGVLPG